MIVFVMILVLFGREGRETGGLFSVNPKGRDYGLLAKPQSTEALEIGSLVSGETKGYSGPFFAFMLSPGPKQTD